MVTGLKSHDGTRSLAEATSPAEPGHNLGALHQKTGEIHTSFRLFEIASLRIFILANEPTAHLRLPNHKNITGRLQSQGRRHKG